MEQDFGFRMGQLIKRLGLNQQEFADRLNCSPSFISDVVRGLKKPGTEFFAKLSNTFNVSLDWLVCGRGELPACGNHFAHIDPLVFNAAANRLELVLEAAKGNEVAMSTLKSLLHNEEIQAGEEAEILKFRLKSRIDELNYLLTLYNSRAPTETVEQFSQRVLSEAVQKYNPLTTDMLVAFVNTRS